MATDILGGILGAVGGIFDNAQQKKAINRAVNYQVNGLNEAADITLQEAAHRRGAVKPWYDSGLAQNYVLENALGQNGASGKADALARFRDYNPGYEYARNESLRGIDSAFNANGGRLSGGALMALQDRASNLADQNYNSWLDRVTALSEQGRTTAVQDAALGAASAGNLAQIYANRGDVKAAGAIGKANANSTLLGSLGNLAGFFGFS